jgi:hypothetical protein
MTTMKTYAAKVWRESTWWSRVTCAIYAACATAAAVDGQWWLFIVAIAMLSYEIEVTGKRADIKHWRHRYEVEKAKNAEANNSTSTTIHFHGDPVKAFKRAQQIADLSKIQRSARG